MTIVVPTQLRTAVQAVKYMLGGRAFVTIISNKTNKHFSYKITVAPNNAQRHFVWVHTSHGYRFVGTLDKNGRKFFRSKKSIPREWLMYKAFLWAWRHVNSGYMPRSLCIYHENTCCRCGRKLIDPKSIRAGIGPECAKRVDW